MKHVLIAVKDDTKASVLTGALKAAGIDVGDIAVFSMDPVKRLTREIESLHRKRAKV